MRKLLLIGLGLCVAGALWKAEEEEDGVAVATKRWLREKRLRRDWSRTAKAM